MVARRQKRKKETDVAKEGFDPSSSGYRMKVPMSPAVELVSIVDERRLNVSLTALPLRHSAERTVVRFNIYTQSLLPCKIFPHSESSGVHRHVENTRLV